MINPWYIVNQRDIDINPSVGKQGQVKRIRQRVIHYCILSNRCVGNNQIFIQMHLRRTLWEEKALLILEYGWKNTR